MHMVTKGTTYTYLDSLENQQDLEFLEHPEDPENLEDIHRWIIKLTYIATV